MATETLEGIADFGEATVTSKGQITLPSGCGGRSIFLPGIG